MEEKYDLFPVEDTHPHKEGKDCPCNPTERKVEDGIVYVHNAFDGRELLEKAEKNIAENLN